MQEDRLPELFYTYAEEPESLLLHAAELERLLRIDAAGRTCACAVVIRGEAGSGRRHLVRHFSRRSGRRVLFADSETILPAYSQYGGALLYMAARRAAEENAAVCLCGRKDEEQDDSLWRSLVSELARFGCFLIITAEPGAGMPVEAPCAWIELELGQPNLAEREMLWRTFLEGCQVEPGASPEELAVRYRLNPGAIRRAADTAVLSSVSRGDKTVTRRDVADAVRVHSPGEINEQAQKMRCVFTWDDLVADRKLKRKLENLCSYVRYRDMVGEQWGFYEKRPYGNGVCALFCGPPGTGKTMAAQVVAREAGLGLYRADLSQISSKYIGETQKNISRIFERAKEQNAILFFDEADALFAKRTQVKDANDRHANAETAHLLQKLEEYEGVTILATNLKNNFDDAFRRRIRMIVNFPLPDREARRLLFQKALPQKAPVQEGLDLDFYADRFELSGSEIKEIVMDAAFLAASEQERIGEEHIREAIKNCMEKYGRVISEIDFDRGDEGDGF